MRSEAHKLIRGLYGIADADSADGDPERLAAGLLAGGCRIIQLRAKTWSEQQITDAAKLINPRCTKVGALFIVNDHPHIAAEVGAGGLHLGQDDGDLDVARRIVGEHVIIGRSSHTSEQFNKAGFDADYVAIGPLFSTANIGRPKPELGLSTLRQCLARRSHNRPVVAIGGIQPEHIPELTSIGVNAWAVIGAVANAKDPTKAARSFIQAHP